MTAWESTSTCLMGAGRAAVLALSNYKDGDKLYQSFEEGSHLKEYIYKWTGGTGKYEGASGGGTYMYESLTDTLSGGRFKGKIILP